MIDDRLNLSELSELWIDAKEQEKKAIAYRRKIEDKILSLVGFAENHEGTEIAEPEGYTVKITGRMTRRVDSNKLQEIAAEHGLTAHLSELFRWKPEINLRAWRNADEAITRPLAGAITTTPGRASVSITPTKEK